MADEQKDKGEMPAPEVKEPKEAAPKSEVKADADTVAKANETEVELEKVRKALKEANREAAERRKRLDELEEAERKRKEAEMTDAEKRDAKIKELEADKVRIEAKLKQREYADLQIKVAKAVAKELELSFEIVEPFVDRLRGDDESALTDDAKKVFAVLPKQTQEQPKGKPKIEPTNPANGVKGETLAQRKARLQGQNVGAMYDPLWVQERGGGVTIVEK